MTAVSGQRYVATTSELHGSLEFIARTATTFTGAQPFDVDLVADGRIVATSESGTPVAGTDIAITLGAGEHKTFPFTTQVRPCGAPLQHGQYLGVLIVNVEDPDVEPIGKSLTSTPFIVGID